MARMDSTLLIAICGTIVNAIQCGGFIASAIMNWDDMPRWANITYLTLGIGILTLLAALWTYGLVTGKL